MTKEQYARIVAAALNEGTAGFEMAEALALDIPAESDRLRLSNAIGEAIKEIVKAGGKDYARETLGRRRNAALWVQKNASQSQDRQGWGWAEGSSLRAHEIAAGADLDWAEWSAEPRTMAASQKMAGHRISGETNDYQLMSNSEQVDAARALATAAPGIFLEAAVIAEAEKTVTLEAGRERQRILDAENQAKRDEGRIDSVGATPLGDSRKTRIKSMLIDMHREERQVVKWSKRVLADRAELSASMTDADHAEFDAIFANLATMYGQVSK